MGTNPPEAEGKCEISVQFLTFSCAKFIDFTNTGAQLGQYLYKQTTTKILVQTTGDQREQLR